MEVWVAEHAYKHGLSEEQIRYAWDNFIKKAYRGKPNEGEVMCVGFDRNGAMIQLVAVERSFGFLVYHAMTPPARNALKELGLLKG
jgi:hypothetical protein